MSESTTQVEFSDFTPEERAGVNQIVTRALRRSDGLKQLEDGRMNRNVPDYQQLSCGCCSGNHSEREIALMENTSTPPADWCICQHHQDIPRGMPARKCSIHRQSEKAA